MDLGRGISPLHVQPNRIVYPWEYDAPARLQRYSLRGGLCMTSELFAGAAAIACRRK